MKKNKQIIHPYIFVGLPFNSSKSINREILLKIIANYFELDLYKLRKDTSWRKREYVIARQLFFYFMRKKTKQSLAKIGGYLGKDHATVVHAIKTIENLREVDKIFSKDFNNIKTELIKESVITSK